MVWRQLPKLVPAGSIPVSCSNRAEMRPKRPSFANGRFFFSALPLLRLA